MNEETIQLPTGIRACLFDFDLTLADGGLWIVRCYQDVLHRHGFTDVSDEVVRSTIGLTVEDSFDVMTGIRDADRLWSLRMEYKAICRPHMAENTIFFPDAAAFVRRLHAHDVLCAIVSTKETAVLRHSLERCNMSDAFTAVIGLDEVSTPKPSPEGIKHVLDKLSLSKDAVVYFGDSTVDGEAAQRADVAFVGVAKGVHTKEELAAFPHIAVIESYDVLRI